MTTAQTPEQRDPDAPPPGEQSPPSTAVALAPREMQALAAPAEAGAIALTAQVEARIRAQYFLARQFPRNWIDVGNKLKTAFKRPILAEGAIYSKPIGQGKVEGLSIRFAEEAFRAMGNVIVETVLVSDDSDKRVYMVIGMDMETNASIPVTVVVTKQVERSSIKGDSIVLGTRTNSKGGKTYILKATSEDDYRSKEQAALQKARRDVIIFLTPGDVREECELVIRATLADRDRKDPQGAIQRVAELFFTLGVTVAEIEKFLGHPIRTMNEAELHVLRSLYTAIKEGEGTWADVIEAKLGTNTAGEAAPADKPKGATATLKEKIGANGDPEPEHIKKLRAKSQRTIEEAERLRDWDLDHPAK